MSGGGGGRIRIDRLRAADSFYGPRRAERPSDPGGSSADCPFCPGHEHQTGAMLTADPGPAWSSRVIANLYPAVVEPDGRHEVIVEMRAHDAVWPALAQPELERILRVYQTRERVALVDGYAFVTIFKNGGAGAGASLAHPHAQVIALRVIPRSIAVRLERLTPDCDVCATVRDGAARIVAHTGDAIAYVPQAARTAFEVRIAPLEHAPRFSACSAATVSSLAATLHDVLKRLAARFGEELPFNMVVQSAPRDPRAEKQAHFELELVPRVENFGGFELGTGGYLVSRAPEDAAAILRATIEVHA